MCNLVELLIEQGRKEGWEEGLHLGKVIASRRFVGALIRHGFSREQALFLLDINEDDLKKSEKFCLEKGLLEENLLEESLLQER